jgi:hypothetical protein
MLFIRQNSTQAWAPADSANLVWVTKYQLYIKPSNITESNDKYKKGNLDQ